MSARAGVVVALAALLAGCGGPGTARDRSIVVVGVRTPPNNLDPLQANDETSQRLGQLVFSCLMDVGEDLRVVPRLAARLDNPDPLTYIAHLRRGVRFHDGHELTSKDVVYTYASFLDPAYISPFKGAFRVMQSVRALDDYTVEFKLKEPFAAFPAQLAGVPPIVPAGSGTSMRTFPIGTGPYRFVSAQEDVVTLAAFESYFDGLPNNAGIVLKVVPDDTMRGLELRKGSVDIVVNDLPPDMVYQLEKSGAFTVARDPGLDFSYLGFNMRDPILQDKRVRHAIGYAINRDAIVTYLRRGLARPAVGLVPPQAWAFEPDVRTFPYDPARAKALLDEAGYRDPDGDGPQPRLRLSLKISTNEETRLQSTVMQQDLRRVGIDLDLRSYEFATFYADVLKGDFQIFSLQWVGGALADPDIIRRVFHSTQVPPAGFNRGYYKNPEVDRLIDEASAALSEGDRRAKYSRAQQLIAEDAPYIPIWNRVNVILAQPGFSGLHLPLTGDFQSLKDVRWAGAGPPSDAPRRPN
ncbi:MAG TPA: ABC transporter substrate-binding protein [Vicinamibacterales bacterium]|nr:ABC transporter substrate-binding protein [Vicinamibacterales bacterium]